MKWLSSIFAPRSKPSIESRSVAVVNMIPFSDSIAFQATFRGITYKVSTGDIEGDRDYCKADVIIRRLTKPKWERECHGLRLIVKALGGGYDNADWQDSYLIEKFEKEGLLAHGEYSNIQD